MTGLFFPEAGRKDVGVGDLGATSDGEVVLAIVDADTVTTDDVPDAFGIAVARSFGVVLDGALVLAAAGLERRSEPVASSIAALAFALIGDGSTRLGTLVVDGGPEAAGIGVAELVVAVTDAAALSTNGVVDPLAVRAVGTCAVREVVAAAGFTAGVSVQAIALVHGEHLALRIVDTFLVGNASSFRVSVLALNLARIFTPDADFLVDGAHGGVGSLDATAEADLTERVPDAVGVVLAATIVSLVL